MKRIHNLKRTIALFLAMLMAATSTAFADWDSFQGNNDNNGITDIAVTSRNPSSTTVNLPNDGATTGLDVEPLVYGSRIYAFHNGGNNGATVTAVDATDGSQLWTTVVGPEAKNISQIATPVLTEDGKTMYGAYTYTEALGTTASFTESIGVGKTADVTFDFTLPRDYSSIQIFTGLSNTDWTEDPDTSLSAVVTIKDGSTTVAEITNSTSYQNQGYSFYPSGYTFKEGVKYTVSVSLTNNTNSTVTWNGADINLPLNCWKMFKVDNIDNSQPSVTPLTNETTKADVSGYGQISTPFTLADSKVYFGIYDGDHAYYQVDVSGTDLDGNKPVVPVAQFTPDGEGFYYAGALVLGDHVIFGSDNGTLYMQSAENFTTTVDSLVLPDAGRIRSSISYDADYNTIYLTSYDGFLWEVKLTDSGFDPDYHHMSIAQGKIKNSVSTPVVTKNGMIYVSVYGYGGADEGFAGKGYIVATRRGSVAINSKANIIYSGDMVQCSPVVYSNPTISTDYIYFTTNVSNGTGYCYQCKYTVSSEGTGKIWSVTPESGGNGYAVQGFAMGTCDVTIVIEGIEIVIPDVPFSTFGNDANQLTIVRQPIEF